MGHQRRRPLPATLSSHPGSDYSAHRLPANSVRTIWVSSNAASFAPSPSGIQWKDIDNAAGKLEGMKLYCQSKAGDIIVSHESAQRLGKEGIISVAVHPGLLRSGLQRNMSRLQMFFIVS